MWISVRYGNKMSVILVVVFITSPVFGKSFKKNLRDGVSLGSQLITNPQVQSVIYGNTGMGCLSWQQITNLCRTLTHQVDVLEEGLEEAEEFVDHFRDVGVGVITTFSILVFLAIVWSFENWESIWKLFSKVKSPFPAAPTLENIRRTMGDFPKPIFWTS